MSSRPITPASPLAAVCSSRSTSASRSLLISRSVAWWSGVEAFATICGAAYSTAATIARFAGLSCCSPARERMKPDTVSARPSSGPSDISV